MITEKDLKKASKRRRKEDNKIMADFLNVPLWKYKIMKKFWKVVNKFGRRLNENNNISK